MQVGAADKGLSFLKSFALVGVKRDGVTIASEINANCLRALAKSLLRICSGLSTRGKINTTLSQIGAFWNHARLCSEILLEIILNLDSVHIYAWMIKSIKSVQ
jgi:hypothetical protein